MKSPRRVLVLQGHPDPAGGHLGHCLADACADGAAGAGHEVRRLDIARLDFPLLHSQAEWDGGPVPSALQPAQETIAWAQHLVILFPLWMGDMPAVLKAFFEQVLRPGFAFARDGGGAIAGTRLLGGRSARVVVTMGMPALVYRYWFGAHSLKALDRGMLRFAGISPVQQTLIGRVDNLSEEARIRWFDRLRQHGAEAR